MKVKAATLIEIQARMSRLNVAVSGINFAVLCIVSMVLIRLAIPADPTEPGTWLADPANRRGVYFALHLVPFMGLAFLWFMAVLRHRIGTDAGRLESTVFLGSGMLFVGTLFAAAAITRGHQGLRLDRAALSGVGAVGQPVHPRCGLSPRLAGRSSTIAGP